MSTPLNIPKMIGHVADRVKVKMPLVNFSFGSYEEVTTILVAKDGKRSEKDFKYPLIWLVMGFNEVYPANMDYYCAIPDMQIILVTSTIKSQTTAREKVEGNIQPVLYPLYAEFKKQLV